ncbi:MAG: PQQ-binding-like beta-propeller repeat protein [Planctomycetota bacterium]
MLAVVPAFFAPLQSLLSFLPQIAIALAAAATAIFRPQVYRWAWHQAQAHRLATALVAVAAIGGSTAAVAWGRYRNPPPPPPTEEQKREGWWTFRGNEARTGGDGSAVPGPVTSIWKYREWSVDRKPFASSPAVWAGRVYVGCDNSVLYCFDAEKGGEYPLWVFAARYSVFSSPSIANGKVYFGEGLHHNTDARVYCADAVTGRKIWDFKTSSHVEDAPTIADGRCWFGAGDDGLWCLDAETGAPIWQAKGMHLDCSPLLVNGLLVVGAGYGETGVAAFDAKVGTRKWFTKLPASCWGPPALGPRGAIVGIGNGNFRDIIPDAKAEILCLSLDGGGIAWRLPLKGAVLAAALVSGGRVYLGDQSGAFSCVDANTGKLIWEQTCGYSVHSSAAVAGDCVVYGCVGGHVHARRASDGVETWTYDAQNDGFNYDCSISSSPAVVNGRVYIGCDNFFFYCLGKK